MRRDDARERLVFINGDVPVPPYPAWAQSDAALTSITTLLAQFHRASSTFDAAGREWTSQFGGSTE